MNGVNQGRRGAQCRSIGFVLQRDNGHTGELRAPNPWQTSRVGWSHPLRASSASRDRVAAVAAVFICDHLVSVRAGELELCLVVGLGCGRDPDQHRPPRLSWDTLIELLSATKQVRLAGD